jgi:hypothetical protein
VDGIDKRSFPVAVFGIRSDEPSGYTAREEEHYAVKQHEPVYSEYGLWLLEQWGLGFEFLSVRGYSFVFSVLFCFVPN